MATTLCISVDVFRGKKHEKQVVNNKLKQYKQSYTWEEVLDDVLSDIYLNDEENAALDVAEVFLSRSSSVDTISPEPRDSIKTVTDFDQSLRYVKFKGVIPDGGHNEEMGRGKSVDAFDVLMRQQVALTKKPEKKDVNGLRFTGSTSDNKNFFI